MRSVSLEGAARLAAPLYLSLLAGFILGFELAWLLMKCTWLDMRFPGEAAIPAGLLLGLGGGVWCRLRPLWVPARRRLLWLLVAGGLPLLYAAASAPRALWQTAPILFRQALGLPPLPPLAFWATKTLFNSHGYRRADIALWGIVAIGAGILLHSVLGRLPGLNHHLN